MSKRKLKEQLESLEFVNVRRLVASRDGDAIARHLMSLAAAIEYEQPTSLRQEIVLVELEEVADLLSNYFENRKLTSEN